MKQENLDKIKPGITKKQLLSICIGKAYANQIKFKDHLGFYRGWDTDVTKGILLIGNQEFNVEYIGTTSRNDPYWFTAEQEQVIPEEKVEMMMNIRTFLKEKDVPEFYFPKQELTEELHDHHLAMIFCSLAKEDVCYFKGSGNVSLFMFVKDLPSEIFEPIDAEQFVNLVMQIVENEPVDAKEMIHSFLIENDTLTEEKDKDLIAYFDSGDEIKFQFDGENRLIHIEGNLTSGSDTEEEQQEQENKTEDIKDE